MRIRSRLTVVLATILATTPLAANAAQITYGGSFENVALISIKGSIEEGDAAGFDKLAGSLPAQKAVIFLTGPGGHLTEGLMIGETIRAHGYATSVIDRCASVCGLIWLAGTNRYTNESSGVGFHAAYTKDGTDVRESGRANAMVGAYLTKLGFRTPWWISLRRHRRTK